LGYIEKETISRAQRPSQPRPISTEIRCDHRYKLIDSEVARAYADNGSYKTKVDVVVYCEKCLDIQLVIKHTDGDRK